MHATRSSSPLFVLIVAGIVSHLVWPCPIRDDAAGLWTVWLKMSHVGAEQFSTALWSLAFALPGCIIIIPRHHSPKRIASFAAPDICHLIYRVGFRYRCRTNLNISGHLEPQRALTIWANWFGTLKGFWHKLPSFFLCPKFYSISTFQKGSSPSLRSVSEVDQ